MAAKRIWIPPDIYQIKVTLRYTRPPIWRRLLVPSGLTLDVLHDVLQLAIAWDDSHMHEFRIGTKRFGKPDPSDRLVGMPAIANEDATYLYTVLGKVRAKAMYTYDFGDSWEHEIVVAKVLPPEPGGAYRAAWPASFTVRPKTAAVFPATTISWKRSVIPNIQNMRACWIGWGANTIPKHSRSKRSTAGSLRSSAGGQKA